MLVCDLIARYLNHHARHHTPATVRFYRLGLKWLLRDFGQINWQDMERDFLIERLDKANTNPKTGQPWKAHTIRRNILAFDQLQKFGIDQHDLEPILRPRDLKKPPGDKREDIPTDQELDQIFAEAGKRSKALEIAFRSLAASGMRPGELCKSRICDLNPERNLLTLADHKTARKTGKSKRIAIGETLAELVTAAIGDRKQGPIWTDESGNAWTVGKLSAAFRVIKTQLGANQKLVLYSLRHWKGTQVARKWGILAAMTILGHKQVSTTQRYTHPDDEDARRWQE